MAASHAIDPATTSAWQELLSHAAQLRNQSLHELFASDSDRYSRFAIELDGFLLDASRNLATAETISLLIRLAEQMQLSERIDELFSGGMLNNTEQRAALHTALRGSGDVAPSELTDNLQVADLVAGQLQLFCDFADGVRAGARIGYSGKRFTRVVNIGIGGSDLGPRLITSALAQPNDPVDVRYVAGIDGKELDAALRGADPAATLFIICSKTFTTLETRLNADAARAWLVQHLAEEAVSAHFAAVSVNDGEMDRFGIAADARFRIWDWVGGRFSLWSAIGISAAIAIGGKAFRELLAGAAAMDDHFRSAPFPRNIPVLLGLLAVWQQNFLSVRSHVVLPYDQRLELLPAYLQQLFMESLGKSVRADGVATSYSTGQPVWGGVGSHSQHSFAQLLHQGTSDIQVDYIGTVNGPELEVSSGHLQGLANMIAQAECLAEGQSAAAVRAALQAGGTSAANLERLLPHKIHPGNRSSNILLLRELNAHSLGMLLAAYEHQVFVQAMILGINPFDQWGVELGKVRAKAFSRYLEDRQLERLPAIGDAIYRWQK